MTQQYDPTDNTHLRDAHHAMNLYRQYGFAFSPKTKFLYHVVFSLKNEVVERAAPYTKHYLKQIGVLAKTADLPQYRASVETRQQYNRKKNVQTRISYDECRIQLHDDNNHATSTMLKEYYNYYFREGRIEEGRIETRDKNKQLLRNRYGLDNGQTDTFFRNIKIYQLTKQTWFSYTLVNPILTNWGHDSLDYSDGSGIMSNSMSVAYEGVIYNNGNIDDEPLNFTDAETGYDNTPSPLVGDYSGGYTPKFVAQSQFAATTTTFVKNPVTNIPATSLFGNLFRNNTTATSTNAVGRYSTTTQSSLLTPSRIGSVLSANPSKVATLATTAVLLGLVSGDSPQEAIRDTVVSLATSDPAQSSTNFKLAQLATTIITRD